MNTHDSGSYEILVVMDGCTDQTVDVVSEIAESWDSIIPLVYPDRLGKGGALIEAFNHSKGEILFFSDADGSFFIDEFFKFIEKYLFFVFPKDVYCFLPNLEFFVILFSI